MAPHDRTTGDPARGEKRAAFIARITAAATHEFRNILAIVKESSGLVDDLVVAAGSGPPNREKVSWALDRIRLQVTRGSDLSTSLNRVMHGLDRPEEDVSLADAIRHAGLLAQRFARQQRRQIRVEEGDAGTVVTNVLDLFRGLVAVMEWCVEQAAEDGHVVVAPDPRQGHPAVRFRLEPEPDGPGLEAGSRASVDEALGDLPARLRVESAGLAVLEFDGDG
jgi:signal transduction histidine kinase